MRGSVPFPWLASSRAVIPSEGDAPAEQPLCVGAGRCAESRAPLFDRPEVVCLPEDQVDRIEGGVAEAGRGVDRDETALGAAVEDVARRQVAVEEDDRRSVPREPSSEPAPALVQRRRNQCRKLRAAVVELRRGVE
jgi:hypothetical protein